MDELKLRAIVAQNIVKCRRLANLTQLQLAEQLNYTDKAISKWERAEALPDLYTLYALAEIFSVPLIYLLSESPEKKIHIGLSIEKRVLLPIVAVCAIFVIAALGFGLLTMLSESINAYLVFLYALPASALVVFIFSQIWGKFLSVLTSLTAFLWLFALALYLTFSFPDRYIIFIIAIPIQLFLFSLYLLLQLAKRNKSKSIK
ncbi:MAG: helix-turn-helix transcriptional regulator [Erysipelotrichales bacterium]|nr:helix-turn-helix transcriptional regulator [Erysipelotrichales bacterium]